MHRHTVLSLWGFLVTLSPTFSSPAYAEESGLEPGEYPLIVIEEIEQLKSEGIDPVIIEEKLQAITTGNLEQAKEAINFFRELNSPPIIALAFEHPDPTVQTMALHPLTLQTDARILPQLLDSLEKPFKSTGPNVPFLISIKGGQIKILNNITHIDYQYEGMVDHDRLPLIAADARHRFLPADPDTKPPKPVWESLRYDYNKTGDRSLLIEIGRLGDPAAITFLTTVAYRKMHTYLQYVRTYKDIARFDSHQGAAEVAMAMLGNNNVFGRIVEHTHHENRFVRYNALKKLEAIGGPRIIEPLMNFLDDTVAVESYDNRYRSLKLLESIVEDPPWTYPEDPVTASKETRNGVQAWPQWWEENKHKYAYPRIPDWREKILNCPYRLKRPPHRN